METSFFRSLAYILLFCMNGLMGLSYKFDNTSFSVGAGLRNKELIILDKQSNVKTADLTWNFGFFYDKQNSLLTSLQISGLTDYRIDLNIYPGVLKFGPFSPDLWCVLNDQKKLLFGFSTIWTPGIGFKY